MMCNYVIQCYTEDGGQEEYVEGSVAFASAEAMLLIAFERSGGVIDSNNMRDALVAQRAGK